MRISMNDIELLKLLNECAHYLHYKKPAYRGRSKALHCLIDEGALSQRELMERMDIKAGSMSELLHKMENDGLIERKRDTSDKRNILVSITEYGKEQLAHFDEERMERAKDTFEVLNRKEKEELEKILSKMLADWKSKWVVETTHEEQHRMLDKIGH
ncbi:MAG: MarR family winged helix-turn-helix transcriptional regulator [Bacteroides sp.]